MKARTHTPHPRIGYLLVALLLALVALLLAREATGRSPPERCAVASQLA